MCPSKSKSKSSARAAKEHKASAKPSSTPANAGNGIPASAYNPVSGTFHTFETSPIASSSPPHYSRFRNIDEIDVHSGGSSSHGTGVEYDLVSNNESCSGESEDQKEKATGVTTRLEAIPGSDNDKRDKIRQKNERKHQRQREKRAQELHERCNGYLMSRKLEALAQQLVVMGFSSERATMALILNEGRVEESVAWLFEGGEEGSQQKDPSLHTGGNPKIDITEELARITEMETKYRCTKQEVERAVVSCEGDLEKAAEMLRVQKLEPTATLPKLEGTGDPLANSDGKRAVSNAQNPMRTLVKSVASVTIHSRRDEKDFNYAKVAVPAMVPPPESGNRNSQSLRRVQSKSEWAKTQAGAMPVDKRWPSASTNTSVSYSLASSLQVSPPPAKAEAQYVVLGSEGKNLPTGAVREPVIMMQRPQTGNAKQNPATPMTVGWYPSGIAGAEVIKANGGAGRIPSANLSSSNFYSQQVLHQQQYQAFTSSSVEPAAAGWGGSWSQSGTTSSVSLAEPSSSQQVFHQQQYQPFTSSSVEPSAAGWGGSRSQSGTTSSVSLAEPSSLGLFTGWGSAGTSGSSSPVDWSMGGSMPQFDYNNIDWSLDQSTSSRQSDLLVGFSSCMKISGIYDGWTESTGAAEGSRLGVNGVSIAGLQEGVVPDASSLAGSHEWTSPFAGKDLFTLPRQSASSPSPSP